MRNSHGPTLSLYVSSSFHPLQSAPGAKGHLQSINSLSGLLPLKIPCMSEEQHLAHHGMFNRFIHDTKHSFKAT